MRRWLPTLLFAVIACGPAVVDQPISTTTSSRPIAIPTTSSQPEMRVEIDDCGAPQVTFSPLCETYELIDEWHVGGPADADALASAALDGLRAHQGVSVEAAPRTLFCAIPSQSFAEFCNELGERVRLEGLPVGPAVEAAVISMIEGALDQFSFYIPPGEVGSFRSNGVVGGLGLLLDATDNVGSRCAVVTATCRLTIVVVLEDNPGYEAGLEPDDVILEIDGERVDGLRFVEAGSRLAGDETGTVRLSVDRGGQTLHFEITRAELTVPTVQVENFEGGVGYIRIPDFESDIPELVVDGLLRLAQEPYRTLIVDLRDNPGGFLNAAIEVASEFIDEGAVLIESIQGESIEHQAISGGLATDKRLIVLVNGGTASAAEVLAAALRDRRSAAIVGQPTFGKDAIQLVFDLKNGAEFHIAVARWLSPEGVSVGIGGLEPDHAIDMPADTPIEVLVDKALQAAG